MDNGKLTENTVALCVCGHHNTDSPRRYWNELKMTWMVTMKALVSMFVLLCLVVVTAQERHVTGAEAKAQPSRQELDQTAPLDIAPESTDPTERAIRIIRNRLHNDTLPTRSSNCTPGATNRAKNDGCVVLQTLEQLPEGVQSKVTYVDLPPFGPEPILWELPVNWSNTIVVGSVKRIQPYLSEDKRNIYTEYTISVTEVLKDAKGLSLNAASTISLDRMGGAIRLNSGRVLRDVVHGNGAPLIPEHKYVMFLTYDIRGAWFRSFKWLGIG